MGTRRFLSGSIAVLSLSILQCDSKRSPRTSHAAPCTQTQSLRALGLRGTSLPPKVLALTFDDGPGPRTKQLSRFLKEENVEAAFFVNGRSMGATGAEVLQAIVDDGHIVANHTETHRSLTGATTATERLSDREIIQELTATDERITPFVAARRYLFRPPFGDYDDQTFKVLEGSPMNKYVGPILWDIGDRMDAAGGRAADWDCWQEGTDGKRLTVEECGDLYMTEIRRATRGIVLFHDPYYDELDPELRGTVDMVMYLVPRLKAEGFSFVRVDKVPEIASLLPPLPGGESAGGEPESKVSEPPPSVAPEAAPSPCP